MGRDVELERKNNCLAGPRSKLVHPPPNNQLKEKNSSAKEQSTSRYYHFETSDGDYTELSLCSFPSPHRRSMPSRPPELNVEEHLVLKRGSVYQSSSELKTMRKMKERQGKESYSSKKAFLSFDRGDSSIWNRRDNILFCKQRQSHLGPLKGEFVSSCTDTTHSNMTTTSEFLDLSLYDIPQKPMNLSCSSSVFAKDSSTESLIETNLKVNSPAITGVKTAPNKIEKVSVEKSKFNRNQKLESVEKSKFNLNQKLCPKNDGSMLSLPKSFSAKVGMFNSPRQSEKVTLNVISRTRFSPLKRMLDPIMKSKTLRSPSLIEAETAGAAAINPASRVRNGSSCKYLLKEFAKAKKMEYDKQLVVTDQSLTAGFPPAHLHSVLKMEFHNNAPFFEFSVKDPDDIIYAKTWKADNAFNWAYTFHSSKRKNSDTGRATRDGHGQSQMVGQMQVSCSICSEMSEHGSLDSHMVTEFILYDIARARESSAGDGRSHSSANSIRPSSDTQNYQNIVGRNFSDHDSDPSTSYPLSPANLHSHMETAAIVIQIPLTRDSSKDAQEIGCRDHQKSTSLSPFDHGRDSNYNLLDPAEVKVIIPIGMHGLPNTRKGGPTSLLNKWRFGGGCDCGGWDMACPVVAFNYTCAADSVDYSIMASQQPMVLTFQGRKEKIPALSIEDNGKEQYSVDFHAQLSALQAFSICIALLHNSEASPVGQDRIKHKLYSSSLKLLLEEEVKHLIQAVAEETRKTKKSVEQISPSFVLDPPFSPVGRVYRKFFSFNRMTYNPFTTI